MVGGCFLIYFFTSIFTSLYCSNIGHIRNAKAPVFEVMRQSLLTKSQRVFFCSSHSDFQLVSWITWRKLSRRTLRGKGGGGIGERRTSRSCQRWENAEHVSNKNSKIPPLEFVPIKRCGRGAVNGLNSCQVAECPEPCSLARPASPPSWVSHAPQTSVRSWTPSCPQLRRALHTFLFHTPPLQGFFWTTVCSCSWAGVRLVKRNVPGWRRMK